MLVSHNNLQNGNEETMENLKMICIILSEKFVTNLESSPFFTFSVVTESSTQSSV